MGEITHHPIMLFRWNGKDYRITKIACRYENGGVMVAVEPSNPDLEVAVRERVQRDGALKIYLAFGYECLLDDYQG